MDASNSGDSYPMCIYNDEMNQYQTIALSAVLLLILDGTYLFSIQKMFQRQILDTQKTPITIRIDSAVACYILLIGGLNYFILRANRSPWDAFLLGLLIYGVYETTSYALFTNWSLQIVLLDTLWGGVLLSLTTWLVYWFSGRERGFF